MGWRFNQGNNRKSDNRIWTPGAFLHVKRVLKERECHLSGMLGGTGLTRDIMATTSYQKYSKNYISFPHQPQKASLPRTL